VFLFVWLFCWAWWYLVDGPCWINCWYSNAWSTFGFCPHLQVFAVESAESGVLQHQCMFYACITNFDSFWCSRFVIFEIKFQVLFCKASQVSFCCSQVFPNIKITHKQMWAVLIVGWELYLEPTLNFRGRVVEYIFPPCIYVMVITCDNQFYILECKVEISAIIFTIVAVALFVFPLHLIVTGVWWCRRVNKAET